MSQRILKRIKVADRYYEFIRTVFTDAGSLEAVKPFNSIPRPPAIPFLGNWHLYKLGYYDSLRYQNVLEQLYTKYGPVVSERIGWQRPVIHIFDVQDIETVYKNEDKYPKLFPLNDFLKIYRAEEKICEGLGQTNDEEWYKLKTSIRDLMLKATSALVFIQCVNEITDDLVKLIYTERNDDYQIRNLANLVGRWNVEVGSQIALGRRLGCLAENGNLALQIMNTNREVLRLTAELKFALPFYKYVKTPKLRSIMQKEHVLHKIIYQLFEDVVSEIKGNPQVDCKFLSTLLSQPNITEDEAIVIGSTLILDSLVTTNPVLINNLYALATNEDVQNKAFEEICNISSSGDFVDTNMLDKLTYLKAIIKESFRMYPNGTEIARINKKPLVLSNYHIPAGTHLSLNLLVHFRSKKYFPEPNMFKPERWLRNSVSYSGATGTVLSPFGRGARTCSGRRFAEQDLLISLFKILKNFKLVYPQGEPPLDLVFQTLIFPHRNLPIQFIPRK